MIILATIKLRFELRQVAAQKLTNDSSVSEVVDFLSFYWRLLGRTAIRNFRCALVLLRLGLVTYDLAHLITHMEITLKLCCLR